MDYGFYVDEQVIVDSSDGMYEGTVTNLRGDCVTWTARPYEEHYQLDIDFTRGLTRNVTGYLASEPQTLRAYVTDPLGTRRDDWRQENWDKSVRGEISGQLEPSEEKLESVRQLVMNALADFHDQVKDPI